MFCMEPSGGLISTRSGRSDSVVAEPGPPMLTALAPTVTPSLMRTWQKSPSTLSTVPFRRLFSPMKWATKLFSGAS